MSAAAAASSQITRKGETLTLRKTSGGTFDADAGGFTGAPTQTDTTFSGYMENVATSLVDGSTIMRGDLFCWGTDFAAGVEPQAGDEVVRSSRVYRVEEVDPVNEGDSVAVYRIQIRGA